MKLKTILPLSAALVAGILIGRCRPPGADQAGGGAPDGETGAEVEFWTCSMHPQIQQPRPGLCPLCGMDLIPVVDDAGAEELGPRQLRLSPRAEALAEVEAVPVERRFVVHELSLVGKLEVDETRLANITAWIPGRLDRLYVDYAGIEVREGDHLVYLYSPDLLAAQEELIQAAEMVRGLQGGESALIAERAAATWEASREKLRLWGLTEPQIQEIEARGRADDHITIYSPIHGVVIRKQALEGEYVKVGSPIYTVADLSRLWVKLDAYESDLAWLHYGQEVEFSTEAYPGEVFRGKIAFIDPVLNPATRTVKVRVNVDNEGGRLKPEMFVRATVYSRVARGGKVYAPELAGKWISPMHPEIVKDGPGACDVCGMPLVSAESLGYVLDQPEEAPLVIPAAAPLVTGKRAVVYVRVPERPGVYQGREVVLGPRAGDHYIVREGLAEGELVVRRGAFKIDSAMQIMAKPSMMNPEGGAPAPGHDHGMPAPPAETVRHSAPPAFQQQLAEVFEAYQAVGRAMAANEPDEVSQAAQRVRTTLDAVAPSLLEGESHHDWMAYRERLHAAAGGLSAADVEKVRTAYSAFSEALVAAVKAFGLNRRDPLYVHHCPMAFDDQGANWLQDDDQTRNPYFSGGMLRCGYVVETVGAEGGGRW